MLPNCTSIRLICRENTRRLSFSAHYCSTFANARQQFIEKCLFHMSSKQFTHSPRDDFRLDNKHIRGLRH